MKQIEEDLWQSTLHSSGILNTHAYFLRRPKGNVLFYNTGNNGDLDEVEELGGLQCQILSHRDEAAPSLRRIRERFGSKLCCSTLEAPVIDKVARPDILFDPNDRRLDDIDIIHTPGHTEGSLSFFYKSPHGKAYLFTGDTIFLWDGKWATLVLSDAGGSEASLAESLLRLRDLDPDLVMSSGFVGNAALAEVAGGEWQRVIDDSVRRLTRESSPAVPD